jgi:hypothetical protein
MARTKRHFIENVKGFLGYGAKGREIMESTERYQLRERTAPIKPFSEPKKTM